MKLNSAGGSSFHVPAAGKIITYVLLKKILDSGAGTAQENSGHEIMECRESGLGDTDYHQRKIKRGYDFRHNSLICLV
jgi:hypothetical protein